MNPGGLKSNQSGFSVVETLVGAAIFGLVAFGVAQFFSATSKQAGLMASITQGNQELVTFLSRARKAYYISVVDAMAPSMPASFEEIREPDPDPTVKRPVIGKQVLLRRSFASEEMLIRIVNRCVTLPEHLRNRLPTFSSQRLATVIGTDARCRMELAGLGCGQGQTIMAQYTYKGRRFSFPQALAGSKKDFRSTGSPVAGFACLDTGNAVGSYARLKIWAAIVNPQYEGTSRDSTIRWLKPKEMHLPPPRTGHAEYLLR